MCVCVCERERERESFSAQRNTPAAVDSICQLLASARAEDVESQMLLAAAMLVGLATDATVHLSRRGEALQFQK